MLRNGRLVAERSTTGELIKLIIKEEDDETKLIQTDSVAAFVANNYCNVLYGGIFFRLSDLADIDRPVDYSTQTSQ